MIHNQSCANSKFSSLVAELENEGSVNYMHLELIWNTIFHWELIFTPFKKSARHQMKANISFYKVMNPSLLIFFVVWNTLLGFIPQNCTPWRWMQDC